MIDNLNSNRVHTRDSFKHHKNVHPVTYGDGDLEHEICETCLTHVEDVGSQQTLDYIFECFYCDEDKEGRTKSIQLESELLRVEKFLVNQSEKERTGMTKKYTQLSDHYGISCELVYTGKIRVK